MTTTPHWPQANGAPPPVKRATFAGLGRTTTPHWPQRVGVGQVQNPNNRPEINAAVDLMAYFATNGCSRASIPVVKMFQVAYNASGLPGQLTEDGEYGPNSQRALQNTLDEAQADAGVGPSEQAPTNCFPEYGNVPSVPALDVTPASGGGGGTTTLPTTTVTSTTTPTSSKSSAALWIIGSAAAVGATALGVSYYRKRKRMRR